MCDGISSGPSVTVGILLNKKGRGGVANEKGRNPQPNTCSFDGAHRFGREVVKPWPGGRDCQRFQMLLHDAFFRK